MVVVARRQCPATPQALDNSQLVSHRGLTLNLNVQEDGGRKKTVRRSAHRNTLQVSTYDKRRERTRTHISHRPTTVSHRGLVVVVGGWWVVVWGGLEWWWSWEGREAGGVVVVLLLLRTRC